MFRQTSIQHCNGLNFCYCFWYNTGSSTSEILNRRTTALLWSGGNPAMAGLAENISLKNLQGQFKLCVIFSPHVLTQKS